MRNDNRSYEQTRNIKITPEPTRYAEGSALIEMGHTRVLCTASLEENVPKWLSEKNQGWVSAEYGMLPRSTHTRMRRDKAANSGRTQEISRLIARSLRAGIDLEKLGARSITVDCDVLQADGGTRTASITGGFVALGLAIQKMMDRGVIQENPLTNYISAISVGLSNHKVLVDLNYEEDSSIETDMNFVFTGKGELVEVQGTAEGTPFKVDELAQMTQSAQNACKNIVQEQEKILGTFYKP